MRTKLLMILALVIYAPAAQATADLDYGPDGPECDADPGLSAYDDHEFDRRTGGMLYPYGSEREGRTVDLSLGTDLVSRVRLFDRQTAYRNDRKACVTFELPIRRREDVHAVNMYLDAYNDDSTYLRAIWFEIDGIGGYVAVSKVAAGQLCGDGTIRAKERKSWRFSLNQFPISIEGETIPAYDFTRRLLAAGPHTVCSWISTYAKYGPGSWITLDIEIVSKTNETP